MDDVHAWLTHQPPHVRGAAEPAFRVLEGLGSHTRAGQWNEVPPVVRTPVLVEETAPVAPPRERTPARPCTLFEEDGR